MGRNRAKLREPEAGVPPLSEELPQFEHLHAGQGGQYTTTHRVAEGGMGCVYRALEKEVLGRQRWVAIKTLPPFVFSEKDPQAFKKALKSLRREFAIAKKLSHPNLVTVHRFESGEGPENLGREFSPPFLVMEWLAGKTLKEVLQRTDKLNKRLSQELCAGIVLEVAKGLEAIHAAGVLHRDISPQNVMITYEGRVKIIDFGISKKAIGAAASGQNDVPEEFQDEVTRTAVIKGKPSYLSPEQIEGAPIDARSDIFTLGIVLWELLTGRRLFHGDSFLAIAHQILECKNHIKNPSQVSSRIQLNWDQITMKCVAREPDRRFASAGDLIQAIENELNRVDSPLRTAPGLSASLRDLMETLFKGEMTEEPRGAPSRKRDAPIELDFQHHPHAFATRQKTPLPSGGIRQNNENQWNKFRSNQGPAQGRNHRFGFVRTLIFCALVVGSVLIAFFHRVLLRDFL